ncbi:hypothetical protein HS125_07140 [bacterium]|nr:hypothetical protein [bacterium]
MLKPQRLPRVRGSLVSLGRIGLQRVRASFLRAMVVAGGLAWTAPCLADASDLPYWLRVSGDLRVRLEVFDNEDSTTTPTTPSPTLLEGA